MLKLIIILGVGYFIYTKFFRKNVSHKNDFSDELIECSKCGTFVPKNEITYIDNKPVCKECL